MTRISLLLLIFLIWRGILPLPCRWYFKLIPGLLAVFITFKFKVIRILGGNYFAPDLPGWFILLMAWLFAVSFIWGVMLVPIDLSLGCHTFFTALRNRIKEKTPGLAPFFKQHKYLNKLHLASFILAVILAVIGMGYGLAMPRIRQVTVSSPRVPAAADGMKITLLADLHVDNYNDAARMKKIVARANTLDPDIVCLSGDIVDGTKGKQFEALQELGKLRSRAGLFAVPGNHEYYSGYLKVLPVFEKSGFIMLLNRSVLLPRYDVRVCGITDIQARRYKLPLPDLPRALAGNPEEFKIFLSHRPDTAETAAELGADLQLSGHTHGGMVWLFDYLVAFLNGGRAWGEHTVNGMTLVISNGTCIWSSFPIRLGHPGEIISITLKRSRPSPLY